MKSIVSTSVPPTIPPAPTVTLELSVMEFALLDVLRHHALNGDDPLRDEVEQEFGRVTHKMDPYWRVRVLGARDISGNITDRVRKAFSV